MNLQNHLSPDNITARALWFVQPGKCELRPEQLQSRRNGELTIRTLFSGISRGTESIVFAGKVPEEEWQRMRGPNMAGAFSFPVKYGYALVGAVEQGPASLTGRHVFCLHPHQDAIVLSADNIHLLPPDLPPARAVLAANMETALNIVWDASILAGDRVAVFGAGVVGALVAHIASGIPGTDVVLVDTNMARAKIAEGLSITFCEGGELKGEFDVLINATASASALAEAIGRAGQEATIVEASWYGDRHATIPLGGAFHARRLKLVSSQVGSLPAARLARWSFARRMNKALELLADDRLDVLISGETAFADLEDDYARIISSNETLCHRIRY